MGAAGAERVDRQFTEERFQKRFRTLLGLEPGTAALRERPEAVNLQL